MLINIFNQENIVNKFSYEIINKIFLNTEVPYHFKKNFNSDLLKNRLINYLSWEIWSQLLKISKNFIGKDERLLNKIEKSFYIKKFFLKIKCDDYKLNVGIVETFFLSSFYFLNWLKINLIIILYFLKKRKKIKKEIQLFYGIGYRDIINNNGRYLKDFLNERFNSSTKITLIETNKKIDDEIIEYLKKENIFVTRNIFIFLYNYCNISFYSQFRLLIKHFISFIYSFVLLKKKYRPFLFLYRTSYCEFINFIHQHLDINYIYETMSEISKPESAINKKKFVSSCIFYSCNHFTNQIKHDQQDYNFPKPFFRRFDHDEILVWNNDEKNYLEKNNFFYNKGFKVIKPINWQPKKFSILKNDYSGTVNIGVIFPIPVLKNEYENIGYKYYEESFENVTFFINKIEEKLFKIAKKKNLKLKLYSKLQRSYNKFSDLRFKNYIQKKNITTFEHSKNFYDFFRQMHFSFGFWKTSAGYISLDLKKPFYYYSPKKKYNNFYNILKLDKKFGYCENDIQLENSIEENFLNIKNSY